MMSCVPASVRVTHDVPTSCAVETTGAKVAEQADYLVCRDTVRKEGVGV